MKEITEYMVQLITIWNNAIVIPEFIENGVDLALQPAFVYFL